jgi:hypothetical protein
MSVASVNWIPLRLLLAAQPDMVPLVLQVLQVVQRVLTRCLLHGAELKTDEGYGGAVTLIQRIGSAANLMVSLARPLLPIVRWPPDLDLEGFFALQRPRPLNAAGRYPGPTRPAPPPTARAAAAASPAAAPGR